MATVNISREVGQICYQIAKLSTVLFSQAWTSKMGDADRDEIGFYQRVIAECADLGSILADDTSVNKEEWIKEKARKIHGICKSEAAEKYIFNQMGSVELELDAISSIMGSCDRLMEAEFIHE